MEDGAERRYTTRCLSAARLDLALTGFTLATSRISDNSAEPGSENLRAIIVAKP
jgi:hypothetical protein